jgi:hypothetical protein
MVPTALTSTILFLTTRQINALIRANFAERLPAFILRDRIDYGTRSLVAA